MSNTINDIEGVNIEDLKKAMGDQQDFFSKIQSIDLEALGKLREKLKQVRDTVVSGEMMDSIDVESNAFKSFLLGEETAVAAKALKSLKESTNRVDNILKNTLTFIDEGFSTYWKLGVVQSSKVSYPSHDRLSGEILFSVSRVNDVVFKISISFNKKIFTLSAINSVTMEPIIVVPGNLYANEEDLFEMEGYVDRVKYVVALFFALTYKLVSIKIKKSFNPLVRFRKYRIDRLIKKVSSSCSYVFIEQGSPRKTKALYIDVDRTVVEKSLKEKLEKLIGSDTMIVVSKV